MIYFFTAPSNLVIAGFGSIVEVDPSTGTVVKALDPAGTSPFYGVIYNAAPEELIAVEFPVIFGDPPHLSCFERRLLRVGLGRWLPDRNGSLGATPLAEEIDVLRTLWDRHLMTHALGTALVDTDYRMSPPIADRIASDQALKQLTRILLDPLVWAPGSGITAFWALFPIGSVILQNWIRFKRMKKRRVGHDCQASAPLTGADLLDWVFHLS